MDLARATELKFHANQDFDYKFQLNSTTLLAGLPADVLPYSSQQPRLSVLYYVHKFDSQDYSPLEPLPNRFLFQLSSL